MLFRDFIFMKSDLDKIYSENRLKGILYRKYYLNKIEKTLNNLRNNPIDINLLKGFYEFLKLTRINLDERFKETYYILHCFGEHQCACFQRVSATTRRPHTPLRETTATGIAE